MSDVAKKNGLIARALICGVGFATIVWGFYVFPMLWRPTGLERVAKHIVEGDTFQGDTITTLAMTLNEMRNNAYPGAFRTAAVIRLRAVENTMAEGDTRTLDKEFAKLSSSVRASLSHVPTDPFLWAVLFWLENTQNGFSPIHLKYLQMSYSLGPNEGWVAVRRDQLALAVFSRLSPALKEEALAEFTRLVSSDFIVQAANILVMLSVPVRNQLLARLADVPQYEREQLAKSVYDLGYYDISIPGVQPPAPRPWR